MLELRLLGSFQIRDIDGGALPKKAQALLAYLAMHRGRFIPRDQLAGLLWCLNTDEQARQNLRQCLATTRAALGDAGRSAIEASAAGIRLAASEQVVVDVPRFEALARSPTVIELSQASELFGEGLLPGQEIASEPFNEWLTVERARLAATHLDVLRRLAEAQGAAGASEAAIATARALLQREPLREDGHRLLMRLFVLASRRGEALRQYIACRDILRHELDVAPDQETAALAEQIRAGLDTAPPTPQALRRADPDIAAASADRGAPSETPGDAPPLPRHQPLVAHRRFGGRPLAAAVSFGAFVLLLSGVAFAYLPLSGGTLASIGTQHPSGSQPKNARATPAIPASAQAGAQVAGILGKPALSDEDRRDCGDWHAKAGYSVDYILQRTGKRQPGFAIEWQSNIRRNDVLPGDVAIFDAWHGHTAYVEQVERDGQGKPARLLVSSWNKPGNWLDVACVVTESFGRTSTFWVDADTVSRFWRPTL